MASGQCFSVARPFRWALVSPLCRTRRDETILPTAKFAFLGDEEANFTARAGRVHLTIRRGAFARRG